MKTLSQQQTKSQSIFLQDNDTIQNKLVKISLQARKAHIEGRKKLWRMDYFAWVKDNWSSRGKPLDFEKHKYLVEIYEDQSPDITYMKSAQTGLTERMLTEALWLPDQYAENAIYFFPTGSTMGDMVQERIDEPLNNKQYLREVSGRAKRIMGKQADKIGLKRMSKGFVYFRGSGSTTQITSVPGDIIFVDEIDRMPQENIPYFDKRLEHSSRKWQRWASTPTLPNFGIHKRFILTDQRHCFLKCPYCGEWQDLDFFKNVKYEMLNERQCKDACLVCGKCDKEMITWECEHEWRVTNPDSNKRGYYISKLYSPMADLKKMVESSKLTAEWEVQQFYNQDLGVPYEPKGGKLTDETLQACKRDYNLGVKTGHNFMGVDVGKVLHVVIHNSEKQIVYIDTVKDFEDLDKLMNEYDIKQCVVDALPETREVQKFVDRFRGRVHMCYYSGMKEVKENEWFRVDEQKINTDRTLSLDMWTARFRNQEIYLPKNFEDKVEFTDHMKSLIRVITENKAGIKRAEYVEMSPDHFYHAGNYSNMADAIFSMTSEPEVFVI